MNRVRFTCDYGWIPLPFLQLRFVTNPTELLWSEDCARLLRLCGCHKSEIGAAASDYERFQTLCRMFPLMKGHPMYDYIPSLLGEYFPTAPMPSPNTCDLLWNEISDELLKRQCSPLDFLPKESVSCLLPTLDIPLLPPNLTPMLDAALLSEMPAASWQDWRSRVEQTVKHFVVHGARTVRFMLKRDFAFVRPDIYHVERALMSRRRSAEEVCLLQSQLFRDLCEICKHNEAGILLEADCAERDAVALLKYTMRSVGMPRLDWCAVGACAEGLTDEQAGVRDFDMRRCLRLSDVLTDAALYDTIRKIAVNYPSGNLGIVTACDLRYLSAARKKASDALDLALEKTL